MEKVRKLVEDYFEKHAHTVIPVALLLNDDAKEHIINIGTSILCTKWNVGYPGGSFVQAVIDNNLMEAVGKADSINVNALKFYCQLMYNVGMPFGLDKNC
jgi:hypothetical protein